MPLVQFLLNGKVRAQDSVPPTMTVLDWLRTVARLTGTKEGCAEGDCGACTIVVARPSGGAQRYQAVNSCLMMLPQLDGCEVLTIEGIAGKEGALHPVQQALIDADATQCGFCTPGFAMAMFAFREGGEPADDATIHEALAGNLCRCTGYRSIVEACRRVMAQPLQASTLPVALQGEERLAEYRHEAQVFHAPHTLAELLDLRSRNPGALLLGGGTDLGLRVSKEREALPAVIATAGVPELREVKSTGGALEIGGAATYTQALPHLDRHFPDFGVLVRRIGSRQIRNLGTFAGNLATASPIGDTLPCLMVLNASVALASHAGTRSLRVEEFITGYRKTALRADEVIAGIRIPLLKDETFRAYKLSKRFDQDISTLVAAFTLSLEGRCVKRLRAAFGGMAARVRRATHLEEALQGRAWTPPALADVDALIAGDFTPLSDHRGSAVYRLRAAAGLVRRLQIETTSAVSARVDAL